MKNLLLFLSFSILSLATSAQKKGKLIPQDSIIKKWSRSIVNIATWKRLYTDEQIKRHINENELKLDSFTKAVVIGK